MRARPTRDEIGAVHAPRDPRWPAAALRHAGADADVSHRRCDRHGRTRRVCGADQPRRPRRVARVCARQRRGRAGRSGARPQQRRRRVALGLGRVARRCRRAWR